MLWNALIDILSLLLFFIAGRYIFSFKRKVTPHRILFFLFLTIFLSILISHIHNPLLSFCTSIAYIFFVMCKTYDAPKQILLPYSCIMFIMFTILGQMVHVLLKSMFQIANCKIDDTVLNCLSYALLTVALYLIGRLTERKLQNRLQFIGIPYIALFLFVLVVDCFIVCILGDFVFEVYVSQNQFLFEIFYLLVVIGIFFQLFVVVALIVSRNVYREKETLARQYLEDQEQHYEYLKNRERETRKFRHDLKDHMFLLRNMYTQGNITEFETYMDQINEKISSLGNQISVNNDIADAIFNKFYYEGKKQGITLKVQGHFPMDCSLSAYDLCTILSNLLHNALDAQRECSNGEIIVNIRSTHDQITIKIENHYLHNPLEPEGTLRTRKKDTHNHGFGLENVTECVERNHGQIMIHRTDKQFKVMLSLHNENTLSERMEAHENSNYR